jgi:membrane protein required for colicin V production
MPLTLLDFILLGIMLLSGLLALMRGFTREALSVVAWGAAAVAAYVAIKQPHFIEFATKNVPYLDQEILAKIAVGAVSFIVVLIIVSIISVKISDYVVDSAAGAFDRSIGFIFGVFRGFVFVVIAYLFYGWLTPADRRDVWVRDAFSMPTILYAGGEVADLIESLGGVDVANTIRSTALQTSKSASNERTEPIAEPGYEDSQTRTLDNLMEGTGGDTQKSTLGQSTSQ